MTSQPITRTYDGFATSVVLGREAARRSIGIVAATLLAVAIALTVYRPWTSTHLPVRDQVVLLAGLPDADSWSARLGDLIQLLRSEGRFYPVSATLLVAYGEFFARNAAMWQWARLAFTMLGTVLAFVTLRRLGAATPGAITGAALFLIGESVVPATNYVLVWESHGIPLFLGATLLAAGYQNDPRPMRSAAAIAMLMVLAIWAKEPFLACLPFLLLVGLCHQGEGDYRAPALSKRNVVLVSTVTVAVTVLCIMPILITKMEVQSGGHVTHYTMSAVSARHATDVAKVMFALSTRAAHYPTNLLLYGLTVFAAVLAVRTRAGRPALIGGAVALSLPTAGMLIYLPWRFTPGYYGLPFLLGPALLVALAITILGRRLAPPMRSVPVIVSGIALAYAALVAFNTTGAYYAHAHVEGEVAQALARARTSNAFMVGVGNPTTSGDFGAELVEYSRALGASGTLRIKDVACETAATRAQAAAGDGVILFTHWCPHTARPAAQPAVIMERSYRTIDWKSFRTSVTNVSGEVWGL